MSEHLTGPFNHLPTHEDAEKDKAAEPIPTPNPNQQFTLDDLDREYPEWRAEVGGDPEIVAIQYERTKALREIGVKIGLGHSLLNMGGAGLEWAIGHTPPEVGRRFLSHGIANKYDPVEAFDELMHKRIDPDRPFYSMNFIDAGLGAGAFGAERPLTSGGFIVVGQEGETLEESGIKYVIIGEEYSTVFDILQKRYPEVIIVPWNEAPTFLTHLSNEAGITKIPLDTLEPTNPPTYPAVVDITQAHIVPYEAHPADIPRKIKHEENDPDEGPLVW